eukprot:scaffold244892_cov17-Tisochrysis_lutea.AAC.1
MFISALNWVGNRVGLGGWRLYPSNCYWTNFCCARGGFAPIGPCLLLDRAHGNCLAVFPSVIKCKRA